VTGGGERGEKPAGRPSVRTARVGDAEAIAAIGSVGFRAVHDDIVGEEFAAAVVEQTYSLGALRECITLCAAADDAEFLVAERDGDVLGYVHYDSEGAEPELHRIYVDASRKRSGVGSALMEELHRRLSPGATYVLLVAAANTDAREFYERHGLVVDGPVDGNSWYSSAMAIEAPAPPRPVAGLLMRFTKPVV